MNDEDAFITLKTQFLLNYYSLSISPNFHSHLGYVCLTPKPKELEEIERDSIPYKSKSPSNPFKLCLAANKSTPIHVVWERLRCNLV